MVLERENLERATGAVGDEISLLHKLSNTIRRASKEYQNAKAANSFKLKDDEGNDLEDVFRERYASNIHDQFPKISEAIRMRLASTMLLRRKRILYRKSRYAKAPIRLKETAPQPTVRPVQTQSVVQPIRQEQVPSSQKPVAAAKATQSIVQSRAHSATTLTVDNFKKASNPSVVSATKTVALENHENLIFPAAPRGHIKQRYKRLKTQRKAELGARLNSLPHYSLYQQHHGKPPLHPNLIAQLQTEIDVAEEEFRNTLERDWKKCNEANLEVICPFCFYAISSLVVENEKEWRLVIY